MRNFTVITKGEALDWLQVSDITRMLGDALDSQYFTVLDMDQLADEAEAGYDVEALKSKPDRVDVGRRAAKLVQAMLRDVGGKLSGRVSFKELNEVLVAAQQLGWIEP